VISPRAFFGFLEKKGYSFFAGVPCSILEGLHDELKKNARIRYIPAVNENSAIGLASGASVAGRKSGILIQNSGFGNIINPLTSFNMIYKVPVLMFITWRGYKGKDAPEHTIMGKKMLSLLRCIGIPVIILTEYYKKDLQLVASILEKKKIPVAVIIKKGLID